MSFSIPSNAFESSFGDAVDHGSHKGILLEINYPLGIFERVLRTLRKSCTIFCCSDTVQDRLLNS